MHGGWEDTRRENVCYLVDTLLEVFRGNNGIRIVGLLGVVADFNNGRTQGGVTSQEDKLPVQVPNT